MASSLSLPALEDSLINESDPATCSTVSTTIPPDAIPIQRVFPIRLSSGQEEQARIASQIPLLLPHSQPIDLAIHDSAFRLPAASEPPTVISTTVNPPELILAPELKSDLKQSPKTEDLPTLGIPEHVSTSGQRYITNKFSLNPPNYDAQSGPSITEGQKTFRCEDEPIHVPGAIQRFGALVAVREDTDSHFIVRIVSENSGSIVGLEPEALFNLKCFTDVLSDSDKIEFTVRAKALYTGARTSPDVYIVSLTSSKGTPTPLFCAMHRNDTANLVVCEFESLNDAFYRSHPPDEGLPDEPVQLIDDEEPVSAAILLSTTSRSKPLHTVDIARKTSRPLGSMDLFHILSEVQSQLSRCTDLPNLLDVIVGLIYELTSFHRVMVYQFDETGTGCVKSEIVDRRATTDVWRGLHFPASDIPQQARELYLLNTIRILYDREQETARLICRTIDDTITPLDLKHSYLRAMSPVHLRYLANMEVRASMSISLVIDDKLWGLISCHNYGSSMRVTSPVRELCRSLGDMASNTIGKLIYAARIKGRKALSIAPPKTSPSVYIAASSSDLLSMFDADFGFLVIKGEARTIGRFIAYEESITLLQYIREQHYTTVFSTNAIQDECPDFKYPSKLSTISGMLVIPLNAGIADFLVFFRKGVLKEISWAGNPHEKVNTPGQSYLQPRSSFRRWCEQVVGTSREWTEDQVESAAVLLTLYGRFIEVWRQKEAIVQKNRMTRILIQNAGHEVRTPLNSIINYLEVALEDTLDERARLHLQRSLQASKSLVFVVNDLLNLTEVEDAVYNMHQDYVDLTAMIRSVVAVFTLESIRKNLEVVLDADASIPSIVKCDPTGLRQVVSNLLANAIQHSQGGKITITLRCIDTTESHALTEIAIQDQGEGLSESQLDRLFQDFEKILDDEDGENASSTSFNDAAFLQTPRTEIGLGLAITARFVRLNNGQMNMSSAGLGTGTKVSITVPFHKASIQPRQALILNNGLLMAEAGQINLPTPPTPMDMSSNTRTSFFSPIASPHSLPVPELRHTVPAVSSEEFFLRTPSGPSSPVSPIPLLQFNKLNILVAEDNPLNSRLLQTRLSRKGHGVQVAVDGQACANAFKQNTVLFDIILMDIQMPLVSGIESTRIIRSFESTHSPPTSPIVRAYGRIPIIAVSATLVEKSKLEYSEVGFDGWITKPINFRRLETIIDAVRDENKRKELAYGSDEWENGGWFLS